MHIHSFNFLFGMVLIIKCAYTTIVCLSHSFCCFSLLTYVLLRVLHQIVIIVKQTHFGCCTDVHFGCTIIKSVFPLGEVVGWAERALKA